MLGLYPWVKEYRLVNQDYLATKLSVLWVKPKIRDWSLITGRGGGYKTVGRAGKSFSHAEGGSQIVLG